MPFSSVLTALLSLALGAGSLHADTILFNDTVKLGTLYSDSKTDAKIIIDPTTKYPDEKGTNSLKFLPTNDGTFRSGGLGFFGQNELTIPAGESKIKIAFMPEEDGQVVRFTVDTSVGNFNYDSKNSSAWTVDESPGDTRLLTPGEWHTVVLDLSVIPGFTDGTTKLTGQLSATNGSGISGIFFGDIRLTSPADDQAK